MIIPRWLKAQAAAAVGLAALLTMFGGQAEAALTLNDCPASFTADGTAKVHDGGGAPNLTAASDCQYVSPPDNSFVASVDNINEAGFFGTTDWEAVTPAQTQVGPGGASGTWAIPGADFLNFDYAIVFKDGDGTNLIAFLLNELFASGGWDTPFTEPPFDLSGGSLSHDVSHYTIVQRGDTPVDNPEPGVLGLFGLGLLGLGLAAHRRRRHAA